MRILGIKNALIFLCIAFMALSAVFSDEPKKETQEQIVEHVAAKEKADIKEGILSEKYLKTDTLFYYELNKPEVDIRKMKKGLFTTKTEMTVRTFNSIRAQELYTLKVPLKAEKQGALVYNCRLQSYEYFNENTRFTLLSNFKASNKVELFGISYKANDTVPATLHREVVTNITSNRTSKVVETVKVVKSTLMKEKPKVYMKYPTKEKNYVK